MALSASLNLASTQTAYHSFWINLTWWLTIAITSFRANQYEGFAAMQETLWLLQSRPW
jgi:hypothetical protein